MSGVARVWRLLVWLVRLELQMYGGLLRLVTRRPDLAPGATPHPYVGAVSLLLWTLTGVSLVELVVLHVVIPWESVRLAADLLGIWGVVWCAGLAACHHVYPHVTDEAGLLVRSAHRRPVVALTWGGVDAVVTGERSHDSSRLQVEDADRGQTLLVPVAGRTNVEVRLAEPVEVEVRGAVQQVVGVRLFADDPRALRDAVRRMMQV